MSENKHLCRWRGAVRMEEMRAGGGIRAVGAFVEGSLGEEMNESVKSKDRVYMCLN